jgi:hypothetical protein
MVVGGRHGAGGARRFVSINLNSRPGTSPHQGGWVMDSKTQPVRYIGIDVAKTQVTVHVRPDAISFTHVVARTFIAELPQLGSVDRHKIAALVGLAPMNRDSGRMRGERHIKGGRPQIRSPLFAACLSAIQHNPPLRRFYQRQLTAGKPKRLALVAVMRKLVCSANVILRTQQPWLHVQS